MTMILTLLVLLLTAIGHGLCYIDDAETDNPIEEEIVPKECFKSFVTSKIVIAYVPRTCYRQVKTTTRRFLFIKKTRYFIQSYRCERTKYKREYDINHKPVCCHGYKERDEECVKEKTTSTNATCTCFSNETLVVNVTANTCHCEGIRNESCSEDDIRKLSEDADSCPDGCEFQRLPGNCSAICSCNDEVDEERDHNNITEVRSQMSLDVSDSTSSGLVAGMLILVVIVIIAIIALLLVIKKKISRKTKKKAVMNLSYSFIEPNGDNIIRNTRTTTSPNYDLGYSNVNLSRPCAAEATNSKSLAVEKAAKENNYVTYNMGKGLGQASDDTEPFLYDFPNTDNMINDETEREVRETPYDLPKEWNERGGDNAMLYDFPKSSNQTIAKQGGEGETPYDFPKSSGQQEKTCKNNDKDIMKFQTEPEKDSTYDTPKSSMPQRSNNAYSVVVKSSGQRPVAGEISDREYVAMSVSSKGGMEIDHENDLYVLPSDVQGASGGVETNMIEQGGNKVTHTYSNISMGPYENV